MRPAVLFFDVNETLLDVSAMRPGFEDTVGDGDAMAEWFARLLHGSVVATETDSYRPFGVIGVEALRRVARRRGIDLDEERAAAIVAGMRTLPPHADVPGALASLAEGGYRMVALTNGSTDAMRDQLAHAGIARHFEREISVDEVGVFKPHPRVYLHAAAAVNVPIEQTMMVAAHDWDIVGARRAGMAGAFVARPSVPWMMPDPMPEVAAEDLGGIADLLLREGSV